MPECVLNAKKPRSSANLVRRELRPYLALAIITVFIDQLSKYIINVTFLPGESKQVLGDFIRFTFVHNQGGVFGITLGSNWIYTILSLFAVIIIIVYFLKSSSQPKFTKTCLALVVGGALGNMVDRILHGQVIDFIDVDILDIEIPPFSFLSFDFGGFSLYRWYIFNIADAAITLGLIGLIIFLAFMKKPGQSIPIDNNPATP